MSLTGPVRFGQYVLLRKIAAGGMAEIYEGELQGIGGFKRKVAIKRILPQFCDEENFVKMLLDEARIAALLMHPNIAQIVNCGEVDNSYFIAMEYVDGQALSRVLKRLAREDVSLTLDQALFITISLLRALDFAHKATDADGEPMRVIHRDVSPQNLLVSYGGEVKLVDFGVASASDKLHKTETGAVKGKLAYMAPEQLAGDDNIDHRLDQYAASLVLFECICGARAYSGKSEVDVIQRVLQSDIEDLEGRLAAAGAKPALIAVMKRALRREREERFPDCAAFAEALLEHMEDRDFPRLQGQLAKLLAAHVPRDEPADMRAAKLLGDDDATKKLTTSGSNRQVLELTGHPTTPAKTPHASRGINEVMLELPPLREPPSRWPITVGVLGVAALGAIAFVLTNRPAPAVAPTEPAPAAAAVTTSAPAAPPTQAVAAAEPAAPVDEEAGGEIARAPVQAPPKEPRQASAKPAARASKQGDSGERKRKPSAAGAGTVDVACLPWCEISVDGKATGKTSPLRSFPLAAGEHVIEVLNPPSGKRAKKTVVVEAGEAARVNFRL